MVELKIAKKKCDLLKFLSNLELILLLSCNQIDIEAVISIKCGWNSSKISKFCQFYRGTKTLRNFLENIWL